MRVHVQPIEQRERRRDALGLVVRRADAPVDERRRRRLAEVVAHRAEHDRQAARRGRGRRCARRASSITMRVCTQTSPSGCHSGSCGQPTSACHLGDQRLRSRRVRVRARSRSTGAAPAAGASQPRPRIRSDGRSSSAIAAADVLSLPIPSPARTARRTAARAAREGCRRRTSRAVDHAEDARVEIAAAAERIEVARRSAGRAASR